MKIKHILVIAALSLVSVSCGEKFFGQFPANDITEGNFYQTDDDFNQGVYSCYAKLKTEMGFFLNELGYRSDENVLESMAVSTQDRYDLDHFAEVPSNGIVENIWNAWYNGVYRCNDVLDHMDGKEESLPNYNKYLGECLFIRSWFYFNLYRAFGVVPIARNVVAPSEAKLVPRCTEEEMYELLTGDLKRAAELLPAERSAEKARVTKIAAWTLLGKVELTFGKYSEAKTALEKAMEFEGSYGLMTDTGAAFNVSNKMNKEIIFALYYNKTNDNGHGYWYSVTTDVKADITNPTPEFKAIYDATKDNRLPLIDTYVKKTSKLFAMTKWNDDYDATYTTHVGNDFPLLRYADVVLMYAEAIGLGDKDFAAALPYLNQTRSRAGLGTLSPADVATEEAFRKELAAERGREFALEGHRWYDLVRLGLAIDHFTKLGYNITEKNLILPIPQREIEIVNNNSILWQNPGF